MKLFASLLIIISGTIGALGQKYVPFNFDNGEWYCWYHSKGGMFGNHGTYYATDSIRFFCSGDTIINDTVYNKLYYAGYTSSEIVTRTFIYGYYGGIRNDTINKQVWLNEGNHNFLMYDFNIMDGDSMCNTTPHPLPFNFYYCGKIESIDSVIYCNKYFRRYNLENDQQIIEGIGSSNGLFSGGWMSKLICYKEKSNTDCESCKLNYTHIVEGTNDQNSIYINIINNSLQISSIKSIESVELADITGRYIRNIHNLNCNSTDLFIPQKGIYIVRVKTEDKIYVRKIVLE
jgi:hypothetical protein